MPIPTPFHPNTAMLVESHEWRNWAGFLAASTYEPSHEREYFAIRNAVALIDVSPLFKYQIRGPHAAAAVNRIVTRDVNRCSEGQVFYTPWCDDDGKVIDDGTVHCLASDRFLITSAEPNLAWFQDCAFGLSAEVTDISNRLASLALQGPNARAVLKKTLFGADWGTLPYYRFAHAKFHRNGRESHTVTVSRTGYTGDLGYELWVKPEAAPYLWDCLFEAGQEYGLLPAGIYALDIARIEAGLLMLQVDYISARHALIESQKSTPFELGLGWAVDLRKAAFIGRAALQEESLRGPAWNFCGIEVNWDALVDAFGKIGLPPQVTGRASRQAAPIYQHNRQVGYATSHTFSPILKKYIGLATMEKSVSQPETEIEFELTIEYVHQRIPAKVVPLPFFNPVRKRAIEKSS